MFDWIGSNVLHHHSEPYYLFEILYIFHRRVVTDVLHGAQIVEESTKSDFVVIGSTVVVQMNDEEHEFKIVGSMEANPAEQKISNDSPVGKALLGLKSGETIEIGSCIYRYIFIVVV